mmetsp:Transcript_8637/g.24824  ORF Transcript_8637/g.24824 Transcript_8637/m.24824 type:complete len:248 (-) Transcript_8637:1351-2094(-)
MTNISHIASSVREAFSACLLGLGICVLCLSVGANRMKRSQADWGAVCEGSDRDTTAGNLLIAAAVLSGLTVLMGVYYGARGAWSVLRALTYFPTFFSGSWRVFRHNLQTKPFLWQLMLSFVFSVCAGLGAVDLLLRGALHELNYMPDDCSKGSFRGTHGIISGGFFGFIASFGSTGLYLFADIKRCSKQRTQQYRSSTYYSDEPDYSDEDEETQQLSRDGQVFHHMARPVNSGADASRAQLNIDKPL